MHTLFLDRDGVINQRIPGDYVKSPETFEPMPGLGEAMRLLTNHFDLILVVTNQQGIGKGLMGEFELAEVHRHLRAFVTDAGGRIDAIYHCPHLKEANCTCRKPATGMAWQALQDFPDMDLENAWMVGDSVSDMVFAEKMGFRKVFIRGKLEELAEMASIKVDFSFNSLLEFARFLG